MPDMEKVIAGLEFTKAMITFNPSTGEDIEPENLNEQDKTTYDACVGAISLLKEQKAEIEQLNRFVNGFSRDAVPVVRCKDCINYGNNGCRLKRMAYQTAPDWFCADGERRSGDA